MANSTCPGCGAPEPSDCGCRSRTDWYVSCGCDSHGDHGGCRQECQLYGCCHPVGLVLSGTLEESERYSDTTPSRALVARAIEEKRQELERKHRRKMLKLERLELTLPTYPEE